MSSIKESSLGLNYGWSYGETGWNSGMDENIVLTGFHANKQIKGILSTPPTTSVNNGDAYIVGSSPTGAWVGNYAKVAIYDRGSWLFATPSTGVSVYNKANGCWYEYNNGWSLRPEAEESPYIKVKDFDFSTGYTITDSRQLLFYPTNQTYYQWNGAFPKIVDAGATPATSGGVGAGAWVDRTDVTLRSDINIVIKQFASVADMVADTTLQVGQTVKTLSYKSGYNVGGSSYAIVAAGSGTSDGCRYIDLSGSGLQAKLLKNLDEIDAYSIGMIDDAYLSDGSFNASPTDNYNILFAYINNGGVKLKIPTGFGFYCSQSVDFGANSTKLRFELIGEVNINFDGKIKTSALVFPSGSSGVNLYAGCKLEDIAIVSNSTLSEQGRVGTGVKLNNVHVGCLRNVYVTGFSVGFDLAAWMSSSELLVAYKCDTGFIYNSASTSHTVKNCYARYCYTGHIINGSAQYMTLLNCAADDCYNPYVFSGGIQVNLQDCGCEAYSRNIGNIFTLNAAAEISLSIIGGNFFASEPYTFQDLFHANAWSSGSIRISNWASNTAYRQASGCYFANGSLTIEILDNSRFWLKTGLLCNGAAYILQKGVLISGNQNLQLDQYCHQWCSNLTSNSSIITKTAKARYFVDFSSVGTNYVYFLFDARESGVYYTAKVRAIDPLTGVEYISTLYATGSYAAGYVNDKNALFNAKKNRTTNDQKQALIIDKTLFSGVVFIEIEVDKYLGSTSDNKIILVIGDRQWP